MVNACLVGFYSLHPLNIHGMFFCSLVPLFYAVLCKESVRVHMDMASPSAALREPQPHITSFRGLWFMQGAQMASL